MKNAKYLKQLGFTDDLLNKIEEIGLKIPYVKTIQTIDEVNPSSLDSSTIVAGDTQCAFIKSSMVKIKLSDK
ncbi:MAG: hypothetical protein PHN86_11400 [Proteiniphilum sp.]|jgi:hypothetical protein|nr:hypothetical protein [Proteiniphilum sp.]